VNPLIEKVRHTIAAHDMLTRTDRVLVGVSGGADSTALLLALRDLGYELAVAHLNHGLRGPEGSADEQFVRELAGEIGVRFFVHAVQIREKPGNLEAEGRQARQEFFNSLMGRHGFEKLALAHNREDRVETFLLHLMRGAGFEGLVSMSPVAGQVVRPLIETSRAEIEAFLTDTGHSWRTDLTNLDISFNRNRLRHEVIPQLASLFNSRLVDTLSRTLTILQDEDRWLRNKAKSYLKSHATEGQLDVKALNDMPVALLRRVIREGLRMANGELRDLTFEHIEAVRTLLEEGKSGKSLNLPGGTVARREFNKLVFTGAPSEVAEFSYDLPIPGTIEVAETGQRFSARYVDRALEEPSTSGASSLVFADGSRLGPCVKIRNWKPGDYYRPAGWPAGKVKKLFQRARIPRSQRSSWPVVASDSGIVWVASFPVSREFVPGPCSKKIVAFETLES
jgi:tRNA(Ile)-lysidine synthase